MEALWTVLRCPDDGGTLRVGAQAALCISCGRQFARAGSRAVELLPSGPHARLPGVSEDYWSGYLALWGRRPSPNAAARGWGALMPAGWVSLRRLYSERVVALVEDALSGRTGIVADVSAGAGYVTRSLARAGVRTLHVDLDPDSVAAAAAWLDDEGRGSPMLAVRADYLALPFRHSVDVVVSTDTLIRGRHHEVALLTAIRKALGPRGVAIVDFHNWLHNPLRRLGLWPDNFAGNRSYLRREIGGVVKDAGLTVLRVVSYRQEFDQPGFRRVLAPLMPPTRFLTVLQPS